MNELQRFIDSENIIIELFGDTPLSTNNRKDCLELINRVNCELSPENLTRDGMLSSSEIAAKKSFFAKVSEQLNEVLANLPE